MEMDKLTTKELGKLYPIIISEPKAKWPDLFAKEKRIIRDALGELALSIEHVGSTAVADLVAKPTIDILVEIADGRDVEEKVIGLMTAAGYHYLTDHPEHLMFVKGYGPNGFEGQCYHIHIGPKENRQIFKMVIFRDYLRANPPIAREYEALKRQLASKYEFDRESYTEAKTEFIEKVMQKTDGL